MLSASELATLLLAQKSIAATDLTAFGSPFAEHARRLLLKVRASLPAPLRDKLDGLAKVFGSSAVSAKDSSAYAIAEVKAILATLPPRLRRREVAARCGRA